MLKQILTKFARLHFRPAFIALHNLAVTGSPKYDKLSLASYTASLLYRY